MTAREAATKAIKTGLAHQFGVVLYPDDGFRVQVLFRLKKGGKECSYESRSFNGPNIKSVRAETGKRNEPSSGQAPRYHSKGLRPNVSGRHPSSQQAARN